MLNIILGKCDKIIDFFVTKILPIILVLIMIALVIIPIAALVESCNNKEKRPEMTLYVDEWQCTSSHQQEVHYNTTSIIGKVIINTPRTRIDNVCDSLKRK